jgi:hypothetical protein
MATTKGLICGSTMMPNNSWGFITWALFIVVNLLLVAVGSSLKMYAQDIAVDVYYVCLKKP